MLPAALTVIVLVVALAVCILWGLDVLRTLRDRVGIHSREIRELQVRTGVRESKDE